MLMLRINDDGSKSGLRYVRYVFPTLKIRLNAVCNKVYTIFIYSVAKSIYLRYVLVLPAVLPAKKALVFSVFLLFS